MTKNKQPSFQDLLTKLVENTFALILSFILSTALIGGASYLLFDIQSEVDEINRLVIEAEKQTAEAKSYHDMIAIHAEGYINDENQRNQIYEIVSYLGTHKCEDKLEKDYSESTLDIINTIVLQLIKEKGQISGFSPKDELLKTRQQTLISWYDNELTIFDEISGMIINWEKETVDDRDKRLLRLAESFGIASEIMSSLIIQSEQIVYDIENVKYSELNQLETEITGKQSRLQLKKIFSWVGVAVGLCCLFILAFYTRKIYWSQGKKSKKPKAG